MTKKYDYDAIIIGAGISGLVCGCYLAKAGLKTLIIEKNAKPGGYCTSFTRNGYYFDACVHSLGSLRKSGSIAKILRELGAEKNIKFIRYDPQDIIISPDYKISFWNDSARTMQDFQKKFPWESSNLNRFFNFLNNCDSLSFNSLRRITYEVLLNEYFSDNKLKAMLSLPILGNAGLPASKVSAFTAVVLYKEFMLDGGYYPEGGMQVLPDVLLGKFKEFGGNTLLSRRVTRINVKDNCVEDIEINGNSSIVAKYIISNIDVKQTFADLIDERVVSKNILLKLGNLKPSLSMFILYLGTDGKINSSIPVGSNVWYLPDYDIDDMYHLADQGEIDGLNWFLVRLLSDKKSLIMLVNSPFKNSKYWRDNKKRLTEVFINKITHLIPNLSQHIVSKDAATPNTLYKRTLNHKGAAYGWEGVPSQFALSDFSQITPIKNLYLTGHWTTLTQGIAGVAHLGRSTAENILNRRKNTR